MTEQAAAPDREARIREAHETVSRLVPTIEGTVQDEIGYLLDANETLRGRCKRLERALDTLIGQAYVARQFLRQVPEAVDTGHTEALDLALRRAHRALNDGEDDAE